MRSRLTTWNSTLNGFLKPLSFGEPHVDRHLAALEGGRHLVAGLGALGAATGGLALSPHRDPRVFAVLAPAGRAQVVRLGVMSLGLPRPSRVTDGVDHAADLRAVLLHHNVADALETERAQGLSLVGSDADGALFCWTLSCAIRTTPPGRRPQASTRRAAPPG